MREAAPALPPAPKENVAAAAAERLLRPYLKADPRDPALLAEFPCTVALAEPDRWRGFEAALKAHHQVKFAGRPLLRQQNRERTLIRYWVG